MSNANTDITMGLFYDRLCQRVSEYNARLLLHTAATRAGLDMKSKAPLNHDDAQRICLELISNGGPAFQVGKEVYHQVQ